MDTLTRHFSVSIHLLGSVLSGLTVDDVVAEARALKDKAL